MLAIVVCQSVNAASDKLCFLRSFLCCYRLVFQSFCFTGDKIILVTKVSLRTEPVEMGNIFFKYK